MIILRYAASEEHMNIVISKKRVFEARHILQYNRFVRSSMLHIQV